MSLTSSRERQLGCIQFIHGELFSLPSPLFLQRKRAAARVAPAATPVCPMAEPSEFCEATVTPDHDSATVILTSEQDGVTGTQKRGSQSELYHSWHPDPETAESYRRCRRVVRSGQRLALLWLKILKKQRVSEGVSRLYQPKMSRSVSLFPPCIAPLETLFRKNDRSVRSNQG